jgi:hypothetical protein
MRRLCQRCACDSACCALAARARARSRPESAPARPLPRRSSIRAGYYADPFLTAFVRRPVRRSPLINRGYFVRIAAIDMLIARFLATARARAPGGDGRAQVISLGAGVDTAFWRHCAGAAALAPGAAQRGERASGLPRGALWVEVDFPAITAQKAAVIREWPALRDLVRGASVAAADFERQPDAGAWGRARRKRRRDASARCACERPARAQRRSSGAGRGLSVTRGFGQE